MASFTGDPKGLENPGENGTRQRQSVINIARPVFTQSQFDEQFREKEDDSESTKPFCQRLAVQVKTRARKCLPPSVSAFFLHLFPSITWLAKYDWRHDAIRDVIAGATVAFLHVPQALAYGQLATLRPIHGLYVAFFPGMFYALLGTSRHMSVGVFAVISLMVAKVLNAEINTKSYGLPVVNFNESALVTGDDNSSMTFNATSLLNSSYITNEFYEEEELRVRVEIATSYNLVIGIAQLILGIIGAGFITDYLNEPFVSGFTTACACHVFTSQLWLALGIKGVKHTGAFKIILTYRDLILLIPKTHLITFAIFCAAIIILAVWKEVLEPRIKKKFSIPIPTELILIIVADVVSALIGLGPDYKVPIVGKIPNEFPKPALPKHFRTNYLFDAIPIILVSFSICISMGKTMAKKYKYSIRPTQEFLAIGTSNFVGSFFSCYPAATAMSRTLVQSNVGGKTQLASLVSSSIILIVVLFLGSFLEPLPTSVLAAIVIVNLKGMFIQVWDIPRFWRVCKLDAVTWVIAFLVTFLIDVDIGLYVGVAFVLVTLIYQTSQTHFAIQRQVEATELFSNVDKSKNLKPTCPATVLQWSSPIYFASLDKLSNAIKHAMKPCCEDGDEDEEKVETIPEQRVTCIILELSGVPFIDTAGVDFFKNTINELATLKVNLLLVGCPSRIRASMLHEALLTKFLQTNAFVSTIDALTAMQSGDAVFWQKDANKKPAEPSVQPKPDEAAVGLLVGDSKV